MLSCGHENAPFGEPLCIHIRNCRTPWIKSVNWLIGDGLKMEIVCVPCADDRENSRAVDVESVCEECYQYLIDEIVDPVGCRGKPGILIRPEIFNSALKNNTLPKQIGTVVDIAPINQEERSVWLLLTESGAIIRWDADTGDWLHPGSVDVPLEPDHKPWDGHVLRRRLHASGDGNFVAVVNDYGRYGQIMDLRSGKVTLALDGGQYHQETVPFSFAFAEAQGRVVAIHRTDWNRLDVSDPSTGELLTDRDPTGGRQGQELPERYLDYFHGALYVSPDGAYIADDGWFWHPSGIPSVWSLNRWLFDNVWESEDGPTRINLCHRAYYWGQAINWIDERFIAIGGIGADDELMIEGARIFDLALSTDAHHSPAPDTSPWRAHEHKAFPGPAGVFFSDGMWLFSSDGTGLSRWDLTDGARTGQILNFRPTHHHRGANELIQLIDDAIVRWKIS
jgi:hypothetical protein